MRACASSTQPALKSRPAPRSTGKRTGGRRAGGARAAALALPHPVSALRLHHDGAVDIPRAARVIPPAPIAGRRILSIAQQRTRSGIEVVVGDRAPIHDVAYG